MEVASPLPFGRVQAGSKRRFACAPLDGPVAMDASMDDSNSAYQGQNFKRRRCDNGEREISMNNTISMSSNAQFGMAAFGHGHQHSQHNNTSIGNKRSRQDESQGAETQIQAATRHLQSIIATQGNEIQKLKSEKESLQGSYQQLSASHEKSQNENKVLKKVLAIKQERQDQFVSELEDARRYKEQADQLIAVLRQHLAAQQQSGGHGMGYNMGGPPNVF